MRTMKFINIILSDQLYIKSYNIPEKKNEFYNLQSFCKFLPHGFRTSFKYCEMWEQ